jgi:hypothetical protein
LVWASHHDWWQWEGGRLLTEHLGALLTATVLLGLLWELAGKRAFLDEIMEKAGIARELQSAGVRQVASSYRDIPWRDLIRNAHDLDIFVSYAQTWRNTYGSELAAVASRPRARIRVLLPDPQHAPATSELAERFSLSVPELKERIEATRNYFLNEVGSIARTNGASVEVWLFRGSPGFSFHRFDETAVLGLYTQTRVRSEVPNLRVEKGGLLYEFLAREFDALLGSAHVQRLNP